jgi:hypothetical protein
MSSNTISRVYGLLIGALGIVGLFVSGHLFEIMNVDLLLDVVRIVLAAWLLYAGMQARDEHNANLALSVVGILYIGLGIVGLLSPTIFRLLPAGLTGFDIILHLASGALAAWVGLRHSSHSMSIMHT